MQVPPQIIAEAQSWETRAAGAEQFLQATQAETQAAQQRVQRGEITQEAWRAQQAKLVTVDQRYREFHAQRQQFYAQWPMLHPSAMQMPPHNPFGQGQIYSQGYGPQQGYAQQPQAFAWDQPAAAVHGQGAAMYEQPHPPRAPLTRNRIILALGAGVVALICAVILIGFAVDLARDGTQAAKDKVQAAADDIVPGRIDADKLAAVVGATAQKQDASNIKKHDPALAAQLKRPGFDNFNVRSWTMGQGYQYTAIETNSPATARGLALELDPDQGVGPKPMNLSSIKAMSGQSNGRVLTVWAGKNVYRVTAQTGSSQALEVLLEMREVMVAELSETASTFDV